MIHLAKDLNVNIKRADDLEAFYQYEEVIRPLRSNRGVSQTLEQN